MIKCLLLIQLWCSGFSMNNNRELFWRTGTTEKRKWSLSCVADTEPPVGIQCHVWLPRRPIDTTRNSLKHKLYFDN